MSLIMLTFPGDEFVGWHLDSWPTTISVVSHTRLIDIIANALCLKVDDAVMLDCLKETIRMQIGYATKDVTDEEMEVAVEHVLKMTNQFKWMIPVEGHVDLVTAVRHEQAVLMVVKRMW